MQCVVHVQGYEEAFLAFYTLEVALKITSFGPRFYLRSGFNKYTHVVGIVVINCHTIRLLQV